MNQPKVAMPKKFTDFKEHELIAFAAGEPAPNVAQFFASHPEEFAVWKQQEQEFAMLQHTLYRKQCPTSDQLRDYFWRDLSTETINEIYQHLLNCLQCQSEYALFEEFMNLDEAPEMTEIDHVTRVAPLLDRIRSVSEHVGLYIAQLVSPPVDLAFAAFRKEITEPTYGDTLSVLLFEAGDSTISLAIQQTKDGFARITGQFFTGLSAEGITYELISLTQSNTGSSGAVADSGVFEIEKLPTGEYQLAFFISNVTILIPALTI